MKKIKFIILITFVVSIVFAGCKSNKEKLKTYKNGYDFEACYQFANQYMAEDYGDSNYYFYEAQATMSLLTNDTNFADSATVYEVKVIFQIVGDSSVVVFTYPYGEFNSNNTKVEIIHGIWSEDLPLNVENIPITLSRAISLYSELNIIAPKGNFILLRNPDLVEFGNGPYFFFGCDTSYVCIDTNGNLVNY